MTPDFRPICAAADRPPTRPPARPPLRLPLRPPLRAPLRPRMGVAAAALAAALAACSPTVRVEAPKDPIRIDLNVRIEQEVRIKIDRELEEAFQENEDIF